MVRTFYQAPLASAEREKGKVEVGGFGFSTFPFVYTEMFDYTVGGLATKKSIAITSTPPDPLVNPTPLIDVSYQYNNEGQATSLAVQRTGQPLPDFSYGFTYDGMGRPSGMTGSAAVSNVTYNAADQILSMTHGGLAETRQYNHLGQTTRLTIPGQMDLEYRFAATANNGQITQMKNWISGEEVNYVYDSLSRLKQAYTTGPDWGLQFNYDGFGNKGSQTVTKGSAPAMSVTVNPANNRIAEHSYDASGNTTAMPGFTNLSWDALGRIKSAAVQSGPTDNYQYGVDNLRVYRNGKLEVRAAGGQLLGVYTFNSGTLALSYDKKYDYFGGRAVGKKEDRLNTVQTGSRFFPYGEEVPSTANDEKKFATYYRDGNTGLDYAMQRYYTAGVGRFLSPDPYIGSLTLSRSTSANRYAYVNGNPVNAIDPCGLFELQKPPTGTFCDAWPSHPYCNPVCINCGEWDGVPAAKIMDLSLVAREANGQAKLVKAGVKTDCVAMADFIDFVWQWVHPDLFFDAFRVLVPDQYGGAFAGGGIQFQPGDGSRESGYLDKFQEGFGATAPENARRRLDQGHHFAAYLMIIGPQFAYLSFLDAARTIAGVAVALEWSNGFTNHGDIMLGIQAGMMGWQVASGNVQRELVSSILRRDVCKPPPTLRPRRTRSRR